MRTWGLYAAIGGFLMGTVFFLSVPESTPFAYLCIVIAFGLFAIGIPFKRNGSIVLAILFLSLGLSGFRVIQTTPAPSPILEAHVEESVELVGVVIKEPDNRDNRTLYTIEVETLYSSSVEDRAHVTREYQVSAKVLVSANPFPEATTGDLITVTGTLQHPQPFVTETGREFAYDQYLRKDGILYTISFADITLEQRGYAKQALGSLLALKHSFLQSLGTVIPEPEVSLLGGVLLGMKQSLGIDLQEAFTDVGLIHIVVLSGYNVTIIAIFFRWLLESLLGLPKKTSFVLSIVSIGMFAVIVGLGATVVRASIMAVLAVTAHTFGRQYDVTRALIVAGTLMVFANPLILLHDISFQLSFVATVGLIYGAPYVQRLFSFLPKVAEFRYIVSATVATQIAVLPILLTQIGAVSIIAPLANVIVLPFIPVIMLIGFVAGVFAVVSSAVALPFAWVSYFLLHGVVLVTEWLASIPYASVTVPPIPPILAGVAYAFGVGYLVLRLRRERVSTRATLKDGYQSFPN